MTIYRTLARRLTYVVPLLALALLAGLHAAQEVRPEADGVVVLDLRPEKDGGWVGPTMLGAHADAELLLSLLPDLEAAGAKKVVLRVHWMTTMESRDSRVAELVLRNVYAKRFHVIIRADFPPGGRVKELLEALAIPVEVVKNEAAKGAEDSPAQRRVGSHLNALNEVEEQFEVSWRERRKYAKAIAGALADHENIPDSWREHFAERNEEIATVFVKHPALACAYSALTEADLPAYMSTLSNPEK